MSTPQSEQAERKTSDGVRDVLIPHKPSRLEVGAQVAAHIAQVLTLLVIVGGYYYTVLPVFEKQKISEELSKLQIEKNSWETQITNIRGELQSLGSQKVHLEQSLLALKEQAASAEARQLELESVVSKFERRISSAKKVLASAENNLYKQQKLKLLGNELLPLEFVEVMNFGIVSFDRDEIETLEVELKSSLIRPLEVADRRVEEFKKSIKAENDPIAKKTTERLLREYKSGLRENSHNLTCPTPDPSVWTQSFSGAFPVADELIDQCIEHFFSEQTNKEGWSEKHVNKLRKTQFWEAQSSVYRKVCKLWLPVSIERYFNRRWGAALRPCKERLMKLSSIILGDVSSAELPPFIGLEPPNQLQLTTELRTSIQNWNMPAENESE